MPISTAMCSSFKAEALQALHNFTLSTGHVFNAALIAPAPTGTFGPATTNYSELGAEEAEVVNGTGYTAGGEALTNVTPVLDGTTAVTDFEDVTWTLTETSPPVSLAADGVMIYNTTSADRACSVHEFPTNPEAVGNNSTFKITWPLPNSTDAILRLA